MRKDKLHHKLRSLYRIECSTMAIIGQNDFGWIVDHKLMLDRIYRECYTIKHVSKGELSNFADCNKAKGLHKTDILVRSLPSKLENEESLDKLNFIPNVECSDDIPATDDLSVIKSNMQCALPEEVGTSSSPSAVGYRCLPSMFEINSPFVMDSQFMKMNRTETGEPPQHEKNTMNRTETGEPPQHEKNTMNRTETGEPPQHEKNTMNRTETGEPPQHEKNTMNRTEMGEPPQHEKNTMNRTETGEPPQHEKNTMNRTETGEPPQHEKNTMNRTETGEPPQHEKNTMNRTKTGEPPQHEKNTMKRTETGEPPQHEKNTMNRTETGEPPQHEKKTMKREKRKRKRKSDCPLNAGEKQAMEYHQQVKHKLLEAYNTLRKVLDDTGYFSMKTTLNEDDGESLAELLPLTNNRAARDIAAVDCADQWMVDLCEGSQLRAGIEKDKTCMLFSDMSSDHLRNCIVNYSEKVSTEAILNTESYLIPPRCSFLLSHISHFVHRSGSNQDMSILSREESQITQGNPPSPDVTDFNLIVMDPPWQNKSVKRQKQYCTLSQSDLYQLPVQRLAAHDCLVVVWVTNRQAHRSWVTNELFPHWGVTYRTTWHWLKVTTKGDMVYDFDSDHKKPYESLIVGQYAPQSVLSPLPADRTIISVPCCLHSKKPPLSEILSPYLPDQPRCIELFARNLLPGWSSWGNEVLKHQNTRFFEKIKRE